METRSVYDIKEGLQLVEEFKPAHVLFTHLSHDVDVCKDYGLPRGVRLAEAGMQLEI